MKMQKMMVRYNVMDKENGSFTTISRKLAKISGNLTSIGIGQTYLHGYWISSLA